MSRVLAFVTATITGLIFGVWWFFGEFVVLWASVLLNFIKGISLKVVIGELLAILTRWFLVELPKRFLKLLLILNLSTEHYHTYRRIMSRIGDRARTTVVYIKTWFTTVFGHNVALAVAIVATIGVSVVSFLTFGLYFIWIFGGVRLWKFLLTFGEGIWFYIQGFVLRIVVFFKLDHVWDWIMRYLPVEYVHRYRERKFKAMRAMRLRKKRNARTHKKERAAL